MVPASSHLHIASCYKNSEDSSTGIMMRPLITTTTPNNNVSKLDAEEQTRLEQVKQHRSKGLVWNAFLLGSVLGAVLRGLVFATNSVISKTWSQNPIFSGSFLSSSLASDIGIHIIFIWSTVCYSRTRSGSLYLRKKLDQDVGRPAGSNLIWTARMSLLASLYFLSGYILGSCLFLVGVGVPMGMDVPFTFMLVTVLVDFVFSWLIFKCFDWVNNKSGEEQEDEEEDDSFFVYE